MSTTDEQHRHDRRPAPEPGSGPATEDLTPAEPEPAAQAQTASGDWSDEPPPGRAEAFWPSFTRMLGLLAPFKGTLAVVVVAGVLGVVASVAAPRILGEATNVIFEGVVSLTMPDGATKEQVMATLRDQGMDDMAAMVGAMEVTPGAGIDFSRLGRVLAVVLSLYVGSALLTWLEGFLLNRVAVRAMYQLRGQVEAKIHRLPLSYVDQVQRGELLSRVTNDVDNITNTLQQSLSGALTSVLTVVGVVAMMLSISWRLALVALVMVPLMGVVLGVVGPRSQKAFTHQWTRTGRLNARVEESFSGHALVRTYGRTDSVRDAFAQENEELYRSSLRAQFLSGIMMPLMLFISNLSYVAVAVVGGLMVASGGLRLGSVQAFIQYSEQLSQPLGELGGMAVAVQSGTASAERVFALLDAKEERPDAEGPGQPGLAGQGQPDPAGEQSGPAGEPPSPGGTLTPATTAAGAGRETSPADPAAPAAPAGAPGAPETDPAAPADPAGAPGAGPAAPAGVIEMEHVRFSYSPDTELIRDLSLRVEPGQTVAIVGPTGAGKTTLVNLLMRFYEVDGGRILLDGQDTADMARRDVRRRTGMVLQDPWLFEGTVRENIRYGRPGATDEQVEAAARACYVDHVVRALPQGYDTVLEEDAANISAGERQLLTIARAFVASPSVLILDEATSSVDTRTELLVQQAMNALRQGRTSFIIAHRLSTIRDADTILVMEHGDIVEQGSHAELLERGGAYARLHATQLSNALVEED